MELNREEFIKGIRAQTNMSLKDAYKLAWRWAKMNCLTKQQQYEFFREMFTWEQLEMLCEN